MTEAQEQAILVSWLRNRGYMFFSVANEAIGRSKAQMARLVRTGLTAGVPDIVIVDPPNIEDGCYFVVCIEMKKKGGRVSPAQKKWHVEALRRGWKTFVSYSAKEAIAIVEKNVAAPLKTVL